MSHQPPDTSSNTYELLYPISHRTHSYHIFPLSYLKSHQHTSIPHYTTLLENKSDISHSKIWLLRFDSPAPAYHLNKLLNSFIIIFTFESCFLIFPSVIYICGPLKYSHCIINIYLPLLQLPLNVTNYNIFSFFTCIIYVQPHFLFHSLVTNNVPPSVWSY